MLHTTTDLTINGKYYSIALEDGTMSLNTFLRKIAVITGTKVMCREGGCGSCIVAATIVHPVTKEPITYAVNSCLVPILSCHDWDIKTVEGIGDKLHGYHPVQKRLAEYNGTQCGYCSPGFVMNMYCLLKNKGKNLTMYEIENSFASNICRCTGYRPIADAFKSFATNSEVKDIEDLSEISICQKTGGACNKTCSDYSDAGDFCVINADMTKFLQSSSVSVPTTSWYRVYEIDEIFEIISKEGDESYGLVAGNTGQGIISLIDRIRETPRVMIDISRVAELKEHFLGVNLTLGGGMTLKEIMFLMLDLSNKDIYYSYGYQMYRHMDLIAHIPVRNIGTVAGNLTMKHRHREFSSDMFVLLETLGATMKILDKNKTVITVLPSQFLNIDMSGKIIHSICLPPLSEEYRYVTYKVPKRNQNAHAMVNAGFLLKINGLNVIESATIVYGGITPDFVHAHNTELFLVGKNIFNDRVLKLAIQSLNDEIFPNVQPPEPSPEYRKKLAIGLFYRCILLLSPKGTLNPRYESGMNELSRPVSSGKQEYDTQPERYPVSQPIPKLEALYQCTGEAKYIDDMPPFPQEVYAAFVLSTVGSGEIDKIDSESALKIPGVIALLTAKDIPGDNNFTAFFPLILPDKEEVLCSGKIRYNGQPIALLVAESEHLAHVTALKVKVVYKNTKDKKIQLSLREIVKDPKESSRVQNYVTKPATRTGANVTKVIKGSFDVYSQYHFTMETHTCLCVPIEDGLDVYPSVQWMDIAQLSIARMLNLPVDKINMVSRRIGGGYGGKLTRFQVTCGCALVAWKLNRPARLVLTIEANMETVGKRLPTIADYEVGVNDEGEIQYVKDTIYQDLGYSNNDEFLLVYTTEAIANCYKPDTWTSSVNYVLTDNASNTWCRAPGTTESIALTEQIMDHIATEINRDRLQVRLANLDETLLPLPNMIQTIRTNSNYDERERNVEKFNKENRWKKRGISLMPMKFHLIQFGGYSALVTIFHGDGTVAIAHSGIEMGQGINTKVAQAAAATLKIPLDFVQIKPSNSLTSPNGFPTGSSITSESCCRAVINACEELNTRLAPVRAALPGTATWPEVIAAAFVLEINLTANYYTKKIELPEYNAYGVAVTEVEVDVITGKYQILRCDILEDVGDSISPLVDVGQVEGGFIYGLGYWTTEELVYDKKDGALLTKRTWDYKPPGMKDIPIDLRVRFRLRATNPVGVLGSKATGEPGTSLAYGFISAMRQAITSARSELGIPSDKWYDIKVPLTPENVLLATRTNIDSFTLK